MNTRHSAKSISLPVVSMQILLLSFSGCRAELARCGSDLADRYNDFAFEIYMEEISAPSGANVFISPASVAIALAMTRTGAGGSTSEAMDSVLHLGGFDETQVLSCNKGLLDTLSGGDDSIILDISNSIWLKKDFRFKKDFMDRTLKYFGAGQFPIESADEINEWVFASTKGRIEDIVDSVSPDDLAFIINAIYFKGEWAEKFNEALTEEEDFHVSPQKTVEVMMMRQRGDYPYLETPRFQAVSLPYGDGRYSMLVFLPAEDSSLEEFNGSLTEAAWKAWMEGMHSRKGFIALPRFSSSYAARLKRPLASLGMSPAFGPEADFSGLCDAAPGEVYIDDVLHKTFIEVNEEGTEAAAVTSVEMKLTSAMQEPEPFRMLVDRPFFAAIVDHGSGLILFMGMVTDPAQ